MVIITLSSPHHPKEVRGWHDGSRAGFSTDPKRAKHFSTVSEAHVALADLRLRFPRQQIDLWPRPPARLDRRLGCFALGIALALLAGCSHAPRSASDCGRHATGGTGLLGLMAAAGAFDRDPGPDCRPSGYAMSSGAFVPTPVQMPPDPAPLPDNRPRLLVPGGGGTLMEIGGGAPGLMVPAGGGTSMGIP
jgi:hypothetical protein